MIDFERGAKTTGRKFYFLTGSDAVRELSLIHWMMNHHIDAGYIPVIPPYMVTREVAGWAGLLPRFEGEFYETNDGLMLIPTAETPMVGMHANEIFNEAELPIKYVAISPCFRREAGSHGKRDKGLRRVHQFHKVELFVICTPEQSNAIHRGMIDHVSDMLDGMGLQYREVALSEQDRSPVSNHTVDIELYADGEWLEVSSISNMGDNQSKPAKIRYRPAGGGKPVKCHLLNGSGVALPRLTLAIQFKEADND